MFQSRTDLCYNCGRSNTNHIAMYCSEKVQQFLRCEDPNCWSACRNANDHSAICSSGRTGSRARALGESDPLHCPLKRFSILADNSIARYLIGTKKTEYGPIGLISTSVIADNITYKWESQNSCFRVLIAFQRSIIARVDVSCEMCTFTRVPATWDNSLVVFL